MIYLSIPYKGQEYVSFRVSCAITAKLIKLHNVVFSPIAHFHSIAEHGGIPHGDHELWLWQSLEILRLCDEVWIVKLNGWEKSIEVITEIQTAIDRNMPIRSLCPLDFVSPKQLEYWQQESGEEKKEESNV